MFFTRKICTKIGKNILLSTELGYFFILFLANSLYLSPCYAQFGDKCKYFPFIPSFYFLLFLTFLFDKFHGFEIDFLSLSKIVL